LLLHEDGSAPHPVLLALRRPLVQTDKPAERSEATLEMMDGDGRMYDYPYYINAGVIEDPVGTHYLQAPAELRARLKLLVENNVGEKGDFGLDRIRNSE
jgi:hypothetical protein